MHFLGNVKNEYPSLVSVISYLQGISKECLQPCQTSSFFLKIVNG